MSLERRAHEYLQTLCVTIPERRVGSDGNRAATEFFDRTIRALGFETECPGFDCLDWIESGVDLHAGATSFQAYASPYSPGCRAGGALVVASTLQQLESVHATDRILLLRGPLAAEPLMPRNFPFYNPEHHRHILHLLDSHAPQAILTAGARNPAISGAAYPAPLIEDGDFDIPSAYLTEEAGERLAALAGAHVTLEIRAQRRRARGCNVVARCAPASARRLVFMAHIDSKRGTPGALDNASGVAVLLLMAELLAGASLRLGLEIVAVNGEDHYSNPGETLFLQSNQGRFDEITLGVNLDGVGDRDSASAYSLYGCADDLAATIRAALAPHPDLVEGPAWTQGDHMLLVLNGVPALAVSSARAELLLAEVIHTPRDTPDRVDPSRLVRLAAALHDLALRLAGDSSRVRFGR